MVHTVNVIEMDASPELIFRLASDVSQWPRILGHYRYVVILFERVSGGYVQSRRVRMGARRTSIPVAWTSTQQLYPHEGRIVYHHLRGATAGMDVEWRIRHDGSRTRVTIEHDLVALPWWMRSKMTRYIVGQLFVVHIADRTLRGIKRQAESPVPGVDYS